MTKKLSPSLRCADKQEFHEPFDPAKHEVRTGSGSMKGLSRKKFHSADEGSRQLAPQQTRSCLMLITTPVVDRFLLALFEPDLNSRCRGQF